MADIIPQGYHVTYAEDPVFPGDWFADLRDDQTGRVIESGSGTTREAARAHLLERYGRHEAERGAATVTGTRVRMTVTLDCGHVLHYDGTIAEKYPFWCPECEATPTGKYPWTITAEVVQGEPAGGA